MSKHTPGLWKSNCMMTGAGTKILAIHSKANDGGIFEICRVDIDDEPQEAIERLEADFSLIAAAPELLEALTFVLRAYKADAKTKDSYYEQLCNNAENIIAKAKGAS